MSPDGPVPDIVGTGTGSLVRVQRTGSSRIRTKRTKRHGTQCLLRRFEVSFIGPDGGTAAQGNGHATADDDLSAEVRSLASSRTPFYALVEHRRLARIHFRAILTEADAKALVRRMRRAREDAEWEAAAPR